jgi:hypothetical protein
MNFNIDDYIEVFDNPEGYSNREIWNVIKKRLNLTSCFLDKKGDRLTIINLIKKFYECVPAKNFNYFLSIQDTVSPPELIDEFRTYIVEEYLKKMPKNNELQKLQVLYLQIYLFEILAAMSLVTSTDTIHLSISIFYKIDYIEEVPPLIQNGKNLLYAVLKRINITKDEHTKKSYDKLNVKLLSMKYPTIAQPLQFIVSKYL